MDAIEAIKHRRSIRSGFESDPVPSGAIHTILESGESAPSSKNARPWRFHVVDDREARGRIAAIVRAAEGKEGYVPHDPLTGEPWPDWESTVDESADVLEESACAIFVENLGLFSRGKTTLIAAPQQLLASSIMGYTFEIIGIGAAIQNMWLAATALGLHGTFMGDVVVAEEAIKAELGFDGDLIGVLAIGFAPDGHP